ncbi:MAG: hypothetical protein V7K67_12205 [Nostoc sp.]
MSIKLLAALRSLVKSKYPDGMSAIDIFRNLEVFGRSPALKADY